MSNQALSQVLDALEEPVLAIGATWQVEYVNDAMRRWMARAGVELEPLPRRFGELAGGLGAGTQEMVAAVLAGEPEQARVELVHLGPRLVWLRTRVRALVGGAAGAVVQLRDVTTELRTEQALRLRDAVLEASPAALGWADAQGRMLHANQALRHLLGIAHPSELHGAAFESLWQAPELARQGLEAAAAGASWEGELALRRGNGGVLGVRVAARPVGSGGQRAVAFTVADVSERVEIEEALGESEATTRVLLTANPDPVFLLDADDLVLALNPAALQVLGCTAEAVLGEALARHLPEANGEILRTHLQLARENGRPASYKDSYLGRVFDHWVVPVSDGVGGVGRVALFSRDVTEREAAETALMATNQMLSSLIEASPLAIVALTPQQRVTLWSRAAQTVYGWTEEEVTGGPHPAVPEEERGTYRAMLAAAIRGEAAGGVEHRRWRKDGRPVEALLYLAPLRDANGQVVGAMEITEDITERKRMMEHLVAAQKMEALGRMAAGFGHDLNNLLQSNLGLAQVLRERHADADRVLQAADELEELARRGATLLKQLLLFSRRVPFSPEPLDLNDLLRQAREVVRTMLPENIAVVLELNPGVLPVETDREKLLHAFTNLVASAADAMPEGGQLVIATSSGERDAVVTIRHSGRSIDPEALPHVFEPFFVFREGGPGFGLDLAVAREIVTRAGGWIEADNLPSGGSSFRIHLPLCDADSLRSDGFDELGPTAGGRGTGERLLIVEDERTAREVFAEVLSDLGYEVVAVASGEEAGALPLDPPFDLLLTDLVLPGASGLDLAWGLRDRWPHLKVVLMSGYTNTEVAGAVVALRARFLQKPFDMDTLARELRVALDER